jgi:hypothetical protein
MQTEKIHKKLDDLFDNDKSRNFVNHLIRAYLPVGKADKVWEKPKGRFRCVLTNVSLISVGEVMEGVNSEQYRQDFLEHLKSWASEEHRVESPMKKLLDGKILGFTGKNTDTYMCQEAYHAFYDWVVTKMLRGDKHINWLVSSMKREKFINRAESVANDDETKAALKKIKKSTKNGKRATTKLGDLGALQQLKSKMEEENGGE